MQTLCLWLFHIGFFCNSIQTVSLDSALYFVDNKDHLDLPVCSAAKATHSKVTEEITSVETQTCCRHLVVFLSHFGFFSRDKVSLCLFCIFLCVFGFFPVHVVPGGATRRSARTQLQRPENKESVRIAGDRPWSQSRDTQGCYVFASNFQRITSKQRKWRHGIPAAWNVSSTNLNVISSSLRCA